MRLVLHPQFISRQPICPQSKSPLTLELYDIALLLNYERGTTEPRFRHTKLREVAEGLGSDFRTARVMSPVWTNAAYTPRTGLVFDRKRPVRTSGSKAGNTTVDVEDPDLPENMLPTPIPASLANMNLTRKQLETYYWQARNHDGCFKCIALIQHFFDLFPSDTQVRVRTVDGKKIQDYIAPAENRAILEWDMFDLKRLTMSLVLPDSGVSYITGGHDTEPHAALGFPDPNGAGFTTILDLSALQYGDVGHGNKGNSLFLLEPVDRYEQHILQFADENTFDSAKISFAIGPTPVDEWLISVVKRAKARWEARATTPWCGHCGAPPGKEPLKMCSRCRNAHYCDADHQKWAWAYHKHFCAPATTN